MKKINKLALFLGTATMALTGCTRNSDYQKTVKPLNEKIAADVAQVENFDYFNILYYDRYSVAYPLKYTYEQNKDDYFIDFTCYHKKYKNDTITPCEVKYYVSFEDFDMVRNTEKSHWDRDYEGQNANIYYTGDVEKLKDVLSHETTKLYSVGKYYNTNNVVEEEQNL